MKVPAGWYEVDLTAGENEFDRRPDYERITKKRREQRRLAAEQHKAWLQEKLK